MNTYRTGVEIDIRLIEKNSQNSLRAKFLRIMDLPFDPYIVMGKEFELDVTRKPELSLVILSVKVISVKWLETRIELPYSMLVKQKVYSKNMSHLFVEQLEADSRYERLL